MRTINIPQLANKSGTPYSGNLYVYIGETSTLATIYNHDGTILNNPVPCVGGHVETIFTNELYIHWILRDDDEVQLCEGYDRGDKYEVAVEGINTCDNIAALRDLADTATLGDRVLLMGYNYANDKPAIAYTFTNDTSLDNGGNYIAGWECKFASNVDIRHFGVFPKSSIQAAHASYNASQCTTAMNIANSIGLPLYIDSGVLELPAGTWKLDGNGSIFAADNTYLTIELNGCDLVSTDGFECNATIMDHTLFSSSTINFNGTLNTEQITNFVFEGSASASTRSSVSLEDKDVYVFDTEKSPMVLTRCNIHSDGKIYFNGNTHFYNCNIDRSIFDEDTTIAQVATMCSECIFTGNFTTAQLQVLKYLGTRLATQNMHAETLAVESISAQDELDINASQANINGNAHVEGFLEVVGDSEAGVEASITASKITADNGCFDALRYNVRYGTQYKIEMSDTDPKYIPSNVWQGVNYLHVWFNAITGSRDLKIKLDIGSASYLGTGRHCMVFADIPDDYELEIYADGSCSGDPIYTMDKKETMYFYTQNIGGTYSWVVDPFSK